MKGGVKPKRLLTVNENVELELNKGIEIGCQSDSVYFNRSILSCLFKLCAFRLQF